MNASSASTRTWAFSIPALKRRVKTSAISDFVYYTDRMDYLSAMSNNLGYCLTVEHMLGLEIPERAQVIRVIMAEMQRIASHLFWLATHVLDVSGTGMSLLMYATRET